MATPRSFEPTPQEAPIHNSVFGQHNEHDQLADDTPRGANPGSVNIIGAAVQPERNQPMRNLGDTDQGDRQPDGQRRR